MVIYHAMTYLNTPQIFKLPLHERTAAGTRRLVAIDKGTGEIRATHLCGLL
jgi:hypothetical protein